MCEYYDGTTVKIGDEFQQLKFVGWEGKKFTVEAIVQNEIIYMSSNIGAGNAKPAECMRFDQDIHDYIRDLLDANIISQRDIENVVRLMGGDAS